MEYTQWVITINTEEISDGLNPCCNGIYSMSFSKKKPFVVVRMVLILVVMEYTQWGAVLKKRYKMLTES